MDNKISLFTGKPDINGYPKELLVLLFGDKDDYASCLKCDVSAFLAEHPGSVNTKGRAIIRTSLNSKLEAHYHANDFTVPFIDLQFLSLGVRFFINGNEYMPKRKDEPIRVNKEDDYSLSEIDAVPRVSGEIVDEERTIPFINNLKTFERDELILSISAHCKYYNSDKGSSKAAEIESIVSQYEKRKISYITARTLLLSYYKTASIPEAQYEIKLIDTSPMISFNFKTAEELQGIIELGIDNIFRREAPELNAFAKELFYPYGNRKGFEILLGNFKVSREHPVREKISKLYGGN